MPNRNSETSLGKTLAFLSLLFPLLAVYLILKANLGDRGWGGSFPSVLLHFLMNFGRFRISFPEGFWEWGLWTALGLIPPWLLGWGVLSSVRLPRLIRFWTAFPVGIGLHGVALELLAMAGWLSRPSVSALSLLSLAFGLWLMSRKKLIDGEQAPAVDLPESAVVSVPPIVKGAVWALFGILIWLNFQHALFYPPNYWDALIYYLYYSKLIFLEGGIPFPVDSTGFPELVQGQVGLGLGANYAHLFLLWQAGVCTLAGEWSSFPGQWAPPIAGLATSLLVYGTILERTRNQRVALLSLLAVQSAPYWVWYQHWVSDYPLAVWFTASSAALLGAARSRMKPVIPGLIAVAVAGSHLNYLMASLWLFPLIAWVGLERTTWFEKRILLALLGGIVLSSTWFIRNAWVTGNPVYAFFPEIFGGINIDLAVLSSCEVEWSMNGDGLRQVGDTAWQRILNSPYYFLVDPGTSLKWAALPLGWFIPGLLYFFRQRGFEPFRITVPAYALLMLCYQYFISPLYLYHILPLVPLMVLISADWMVRLDRFAISRWMLGAAALVAFLGFGMPAALLGSKYSSPSLDHTLRPGMNPREFLELSLGDGFRTFERLNETLPEGTVLLTHENRHYYLRDDIRFIHLDDYRLIDWYGKPGEEVLDRLKELGVGYYLKIPNERNHPIVASLGLEALLPDHFEPVFQIGGHHLHRMK